MNDEQAVSPEGLLSADANTSTKKNILIVDDTLANLRFLMGVLTSNGYKVRPAPNGALALKSVRSTPPDLILLDIMMPDMSGYEVCARLKADARTRDIPVIFISALDEVLDKVKAFSVGGVDYITKPFQLEEVLARVAVHLALRDSQKAIEEKNTQLQRRNEELDSFSHIVAHDLKSPLGSIIGYAELLLEEGCAAMPREDLVKDLGRMVFLGRQMENIINELLLLASVRKMTEVQIGPLNMADIVANSQNRLRDMIEEYQAEIVLPDTWHTAQGYGPWIEEVWTNYLSNAVKYGGQPPRMELGSTAQANGIVCFWIRDNGAGITPNEQRRLFTPFTRLDQVRAQGHGLGLSIVQRIMEKLGGTVGVESTPGQGSVFSFTLPQAF